MGTAEEEVFLNGSWTRSTLIPSRPSAVTYCSVTISDAAKRNIKEEQPHLHAGQGHAVYTGFGSQLLFPY